MMDDPNEPRINWRFVYGAVFAWLVIMILLMRFFMEIFS